MPAARVLDLTGKGQMWTFAKWRSWPLSIDCPCVSHFASKPSPDTCPAVIAVAKSVSWWVNRSMLCFALNQNRVIGEFAMMGEGCFAKLNDT
jgi:hypothetical protein